MDITYVASLSLTRSMLTSQLDNPVLRHLGPTRINEMSMTITATTS